MGGSSSTSGPAARRPWTGVLAVLALLATAATAQEGPSAGSEILWDDWDVPHIYADDGRDVARAFGWAQARSHGDLILRAYAQARGRGAEILGPSLLESDRLVRTVGIPDRARSWYDAQEAGFRAELDAFAEGVNAYVEAHPDAIADPLEAVLPVTGVDLLAHAQRALHLTFLVGNLLGPPRDMWRARTGGSNAWAIAPSRAAGGHALLLGNPHLPWDDQYRLYEAHLNSAEHAIYGATLVGLPVLALGFNEQLGWSHTVNPLDGADLYELTLEGDGYLLDGSQRSFETERHTIRVLQEDGSLDEVELLVRRSVHGPVVAEESGRALALRVAGFDRPGMLRQWRDMGRATSIDAFERVLDRMQLPMFYVAYADRDGNIMMRFNGLVPDRTSGDWYDWQGVVPGDTTDTLWDGYLSAEELPVVRNPASGFVMNANDPPWFATLPYPLDPADYPAHVAPAEPALGITLRPQRLLRLLAGDDAITFDEMVEDKYSAHSLVAERILDDLLRAAEGSDSALVEEAAAVLAAWDRSFEHDSRGAALFFLWYATLVEQRQNRAFSAEADLNDALAATQPLGLVFERPWSRAAEPFETPDGLAEPDAAVGVLEQAANQLRDMAGALDVAWGDLARMRAGGLDLPATSTDGSLGVVQVQAVSPNAAGELVVVGGDTFTFAVEFSDPLRARAVLTYGNATQEGFGDVDGQLARYALDELRPVWLTRDEVEANVEMRETGE